MSVRTWMGFVFILFFIATTLPSVSAKLVCGDNLPGGTTIIQLSDETNAHGESPNPVGFYTQSNGGVEIRCLEDSGTGVTINTGSTNGINLLRLSNATNAHAQQPNYSLVVYPTLLQIGHSGGAVTGGILVNTLLAPAANCDTLDTPTANFTEVVRLSSETNAHLQSPSYVGTKYEVIICAAYDSTGGSPSSFTDKDILGTVIDPTGTTLDDSSPYVEEGQAITISTVINNLPNQLNYPLSDYQNIGTGWIVAICDRDAIPTTGKACDELDTFADAYIDFFTPGTTILGVTPQFENFGSNDPFMAAAPSSGFITASSTITRPYTIDTLDGTPAGDVLEEGNYRVFAMAIPANYIWTADSTLHQEIPGYWNLPNQPNFDYIDFEITPAGSGPPGPGPAGSGGDVFVLRDIDYAPNPPIEGTQFDALITVQNKRYDLTQTGTMNVIIRDGQGNEIPGFDADITLTFPDPSPSTITETTYPLTIEFDSTAPGAFIPGQTYTLYATIQPFDDTTPPIDEDDETVKGNNSTFKTFTLLRPQETISVPDAPPWMSVFMALIVLGWLFASSRKEENK